MSNGEIDYSQMEAAIDHQADGWLPPPDPLFARDIADGHRAYWLLSMGPFDLEPGESQEFAIVVAGGEGFHSNPLAFGQYFDPFAPQHFASQVDLSDLHGNLTQAARLFDVPGLDSDGDGFAGEFHVVGQDTVYYSGDGVADFLGPPPPTPPVITSATMAGRIVLRWNGRRTEGEVDTFTGRPDFEGYRVYMSRSGNEDEWAFLTQRDLFNYARYTWNQGRDRWEMQDPPYSLDSLKTLYEVFCDTAYGFPFHPDSFSVPILDQALLEIHFDAIHPERVDSTYRYFTPHEANNTPDDQRLALAVDAGADVTGVIRKLYPGAIPTDTAYREDGTLYLPFYEYEYVVKDLEVAEPVFLSVTAFDHGDPASGLDPLESAQSITAKEIWPINDAEIVKSERPKPGVYPNPYRLIDDYYGNHWENRLGLEPDPERARQVTFYEVPDTCIVSIYTLDGDLVRRLHHSYPPESSEATVVRWDLITRNTQAVKTGRYIWSIESRHGTDVGKLVIVK